MDGKRFEIIVGYLDGSEHSFEVDDIKENAYSLADSFFKGMNATNAIIRVRNVVLALSTVKHVTITELAQ